MKRQCFLLALVVALILLAPVAGAEGVQVLSTIFAPYDFARALCAGTDAQVTMLIKPGVESHTYDPSPADLIALQSSDVFLYIGGENDQWVEQILGAVDLSNVRQVKLIDSVSAIYEETVEGMQSGEEEEGDAYDEHIWTSPVNAQKMCAAIADALIAADPENEAVYRENLSDYTAKLAKLDAAFSEVVKSGARKEIVFGDRFPFLYLAREYGLTYYAAFPGCSGESEPSAATIKFLIDKVREDHLPAIYHLEQGNVRVCETIAAETGAKVLLLHSCHNVTKEEFEGGVTYLDLMNQNVEALRKGLN